MNEKPSALPPRPLGPEQLTLPLGDPALAPLGQAGSGPAAAPSVAAQEFAWPDLPPPPCSVNTCANGHEWEPVVAVTKCPGCGGPILVVKMVQCPVCNEPTDRMRLRTDHLPHGGSVVPLCKGSGSLAEIGMIELGRTHAATTEATHTERDVLKKV